MHIKLLGQLGQRLLAFARRQCHLGLEARRVIPSGPLHRLRSYCAHCALSFEQNFHLTGCPISQRHLSVTISMRTKSAMRSTMNGKATPTSARKISTKTSTIGMRSAQLECPLSRDDPLANVSP